ncbi:MAG TPA: Ldh family oxidoreductase, partial [Xanthobacteraceae bacterium]|nr:Ldh family oxidoreductase [Xanthobacteraceae bacterium]
MKSNSIAVGHEELGRFIREVLIANGARAKDAAIVAEGLVWANLRGGDGHGVSRLPRYLNIIAHGEIDTKAEPTLSHDRAATFVLDCHHGFGPVAVMQAAALAVERAKKAGVCFGLVRETTHTGAIGRYAQWIAEQGCAAVLIGAGPTLMAYHGTRVASLSTSPIAIAVPSGNGPILLDMASSAIANGKILQARNTGEALPKDTVLTAGGEPTTDPKKAEILLPLGGPKGSGLGLMFEMLASVLASAPIQARALGPEKRDRHTGNTAM